MNEQKDSINQTKLGAFTCEFDPIGKYYKRNNIVHQIRTQHVKKEKLLKTVNHS